MNKKTYKADIVRAVSQQANLSIPLSKEVTKIVFDIIIDSVKEGKDVSLFGFGSFNVVTRKARNGINPSTRERFIIPERKAIIFKASKVLKEAAKDSNK